MDFPKDPLTNIVFRGIKEPIRLLFENHHFFATLALVFSGIDAMAYLGIPESRDNVGSPDFIDWCERYLDLSCVDQPTGVEWWGARCGVLHTHSGTSSRSRSGEARIIQWVHRCEPPVRFDPDTSTDTVVVSIDHVVSAFFEGIDAYLIHLFANPITAKVAEDRLENMFVERPEDALDDEA